MSDDNDSLHEKLNRIDDKLERINNVITRNTMSLEEHIRRTNLLEEEVKPIKHHVQVMNALAKVMSVSLGGAVIAHQLGLF